MNNLYEIVIITVRDCGRPCGSTDDKTREWLVEFKNLGSHRQGIRQTAVSILVSIYVWSILKDDIIRSLTKKGKEYF